MSYFSQIKNINTGSLEYAGQSVSFSVTGHSSAPQVTLFDYGYGEAQKFQMNSSGATLVDDWDLGEGAHQTLNVAGYGEASIDHRILSQQANHQQTGSISAVTGTLNYDGSGRFSEEASVLVDSSGPSKLAFVTASNGSGITSFQFSSSGAVTNRSTISDSDGLYLDKVSDMEVVSVGSQNYLYASSLQEHGLSGFSYTSDGTMSEVFSIGQDDSLPVQTMTQLASGTSGGSQFLIGASMGSSSLSVMRVKMDGSLEVTDHAMDGLATRFANVTQLETVTHNDRLYVLASGCEDGISLLTVTGEGRLIHLESLADTAGASLGGVCGMAAILNEGGIDLLTVAARESGMSQFRIDLPDDGITLTADSGTVSGSSGDDMLSLQTGAGRINAGAGNDILSDGGGRDTLSGGSGEDIFVLRADGQGDVITDFNIAEDHLDLSGWFMFRGAGQLSVTSTTTGADIQFGQETLSIHTSTNMSLTKNDIAGTLLSGPSHMAILQALPSADADKKLVGGVGNDVLKGGTGDDFIKGEAGNDTLYGGDGNDGIVAGAGHDLIYAGDGDDNVPGKAGNDTIYGEDGDDQLGGSDGFDFIFGGAGNDLAGGGNQDDTMDAGTGNDWFSGGWGNDLVMGNAGHDKLAGSYGRDTVEGGDGNDNIGGGAGNDILRGDNGNDKLGAGEGNDTLYGGQGNDSLGGADDNDLLFGGSGNDTLNGAHGNDTMEGGTGADVFFFNNFLSSGEDVITDFEVGVDKLRLVGVHLGAEGQQINKLNLREGEFEGESGTWMDFGKHDIFLVGVDEDELGRDDFSFK